MTKISDNALRLLEKRYFLKNGNGELMEHSWTDVAERVGGNIAQAEDDFLRDSIKETFIQKIDNMEFIPSSPCLFNAGTPSQQLSSCFVLDIEDNIEGIFAVVAECAKIFQMSGGAGFSMRKIRPKGAECKSSGSTASGVVSFMHVFNETVNRVKQGNKRNGALKIDLPVDHPEIFDFIHAKDDTNELENMNISVSITDEFLEAVEEDADWNLVFDGKIYRTVKAKDLWNEILMCAWRTGEPGLSYQDNMNRGNTNKHLGIDVFGNPCHEYVNLPYSSCNLASVNLVKVIENGKINWDKLRENVEITFRFLDDMITVNKLPLEKIKQMTLAIRPIGLGTMGFADMLYELWIPYDSQECLDFVTSLYGFINEVCTEYNQKLALERGAYPAWQGSEWEKIGLKVRCSCMTSIAPNGSIAFIANTTGGIEPQFALVYKREDNEGDVYFVVDEVFERYLIKKGMYDDKILNIISNNKGSIQGLDDLFSKEIQRVFVTANDISPEWHVLVLGQVQKFVSLSISKTVNLPNNATVEDIGNIYDLAGQLGVKGITVYRDGCRRGVLTTGEDKPEKPELKRGEIKKAPDESYDSKTIRLQTGCGTAYLTMTKDEDGNIDQTFVAKGSKGTCMANQTAVSRLVSLCLRGGISVEDIADQLMSVPVCPAYYGAKCKGCNLSQGSSCPSAMALKLLEYAKEQVKDIPVKEEVKVVADENKCPECGSPMTKEEGCITCHFCGYSKCSL